MPQSFGSIHLHVVFSTKNREPWLTETYRQRIYDYIGGTLRGKGCVLVAVGGVADHIHLLVSMSREMSTSDMVRLVKSNSSRWVHDTFPELSGFWWQTGYGVFAVSYPNLSGVKAYIANQEAHHAKESFQDEFRDFLRRHELEWDEQYVWD